jgi:transposase
VLRADGGCRHQEGKMGCYAGFDVSLEMTSICIVAADGKVLREPAEVMGFLAASCLVLERVGPEAGALWEWLAAALAEAGFPVVCMEARFYLAQCGLSRLDGDRDGIPCESICP